MNTDPPQNSPGDLDLKSLIELAIVLGQFNDYDETVHLVTSKIKALCKADVARIMIVNPRTRRTVKTICTDSAEPEKSDQHLLHTNLTGWILKNKRAFLSKDLHSDARFSKDTFTNCSSNTAICIPVQTEGVVFGSILLGRTSDHMPFSEAELAYMEYFSAIVAPFLHNVQKMQSYFSIRIPDETIIKKYNTLGLLGKSKNFIKLLKSIEAAAHCDVRVLLEGKSGTGKELIVKAIHQLSERHDHKLIAVDCGAIPADLIESELFGHIKGAFTGAHSNRKGLLEEADGGTMFMDEISNLPLNMQVKLLRFLQEAEIRPLGSNTTTKVDVRIITATSSPLNSLVQDQKFREDLFYRLHVFPIEVPSLDQRQEDIPLLAEHFIRKFAKEQNKEARQFHEEIIDFFCQRHWAGNIREMENLVERLVTLSPAESKILDSKMLPQNYLDEWLQLKRANPNSHKNVPLNESLENLERQLILDSLSSFNWNQSKAARALNISEQTIRYKMSKLDITNH